MPCSTAKSLLSLSPGLRDGAGCWAGMDVGSEDSVLSSSPCRVPWAAQSQGPEVP